MRFWKRYERPLELEAELRASRPEPRPEFLADLVRRVEGESEPRQRPARFRLVAVAGATTVLLAAAGVLGGIAYSQGGGPAGGDDDDGGAAVAAAAGGLTGVGGGAGAAHLQYLPKIPVCHNGHTIRVRIRAVPAHLRHGDSIGTCRNPIFP